MKSYWTFLTVIVAISIVYRAEFWVLCCVILDFYSPWVLFESKAYDVYHNFLVSQLTEKPEIPLPEMSASEANYDSVYKATKAYTFPLVIRNLLGNTTAVQNWSKKDWWVQNYGDEELLCGTLSEVEGDECTVRGFFDAVAKGRPFYVSGASTIFENHPELHEMIDNEAIRALEPGKRIASQIFMGLPGSGSDIHCAIGVNIFRQITGRKKWYFIPPEQTKYLKPSWNANGFSAHTLTKIGKGNEQASPWFTKLVRYTTVLNPGDVLLNPPWFWHGIDNLESLQDSKTELIIGSPVRYSQGVVRDAAFKTNFLYSCNALFVLWLRYGMAAFRPGFKVNLQKDIAGNRKTRNSDLHKDHRISREKEGDATAQPVEQEEEGLHPFEEADH